MDTPKCKEQMTKENPQVYPDVTLRDYFAAVALTGMLTHVDAVPAKCIAVAFEIADAALKAREQ